MAHPSALSPSMDSKARSKFGFIVRFYRKTASHFPARTLAQIGFRNPDPLFVGRRYRNWPGARCAHHLPEQLLRLLYAALLQKQERIAGPCLEARVIARERFVFIEGFARAARGFERARQEKMRFLIAQIGLDL